jgi:hypothetical protein
MALSLAALAFSLAFRRWESSAKSTTIPTEQSAPFDAPLILEEEAPHDPPKRRVLKLVYLHTILNEATMYTKECDGGSWDRTTSSNNFDNRYPKELKTLRHTIETQGAICAVPYHSKFLKDELIELPDGTTIQRHRVRFPWIDPPGHTRIPCDRVAYRDRWGNLVPQRNRFDIFVHMPKKQAKKWGHPFQPIEIYRYEWSEE